MRIGRHTLVGLLLDVVDWLVVGLVPFLDAIIDLFGAWYFYRILGPAGLASLLELFPMADIFPTNLMLGILADMRVEEQNGR